MCQTSVGTVGSEYWTRSYQMQARACAAVALIVLLTGCLEGGHVLSRAPKPVALGDASKRSPRSLAAFGAAWSVSTGSNRPLTPVIQVLGSFGCSM